MTDAPSSPIHSVEELAAVINGLIDGWCARRALEPLRYLLPAWPPVSQAPSEWWQLNDTLKHLRFHHTESLTGEELIRLRDATQYLTSLLVREP